MKGDKLYSRKKKHLIVIKF